MNEHFIDQQGRVVMLAPERIKYSCKGCVYSKLMDCNTVLPVEHAPDNTGQNRCTSTYSIYVEVGHD